MSTIKTTMTADAAQLLAEQSKIAKGAANVSNEYRELTKESQRLGTVATQAWNSTRTPLERYETKISDLSRALEKGAIDQDTYNRAVANAKDKYDAASESGGKLDGVFKTLTSAATGFLSVGAGIQFMTSALQAAREEAARAAEQLKGSIASRNELAQVVDDMGLADKQIGQFMTQGGMGKDANLAAAAVFELQSAGLNNEIGTFLKLGKSGLIKPDDIPKIIGSVDTLRSAFSATEAGSTESILAKAIVAGAVAKGTTADVVEATGGVGPAAHALGISDEESMAAVSVLSKSMGGARGAVVPMNSLFKVLSKMGMKGTLAESIDSISSKVKGGQKLADIFGASDMEAERAANLLMSNREAFGGMSASLTDANSGDALRAKMGLLNADPRTQALAASQATEGTIAFGQQGMGTKETLIQSLLSAEQEMMRLQGYGAARRFFTSSRRNAPGIGVRDDGVFNGTLYYQDQLQEMRGNAGGNEDLLRAIDRLDETQKSLGKIFAQEFSKWRNESRVQQRPVVPKPET